MITCVIVDDERHALAVLEKYVSETPFMELVLSTTDAEQALSLIQKQEIDMVFLDVHMPRINGLKFMKMVGDKAKIVLTTAYEQYAMHGYEFGVIDYLVKPIEYDRFLKAVQKMPFSKQLIDDPNAKMPDKEEVSGYMFVKTEHKGKFTKVNFKDILYVEGLSNYVGIVTHDDRINCYLTLMDIEDKLPGKHFLRIHKSFIISLDNITAIEGNEVILKKLLRVPIGQTYRDKVFEVLEDNLLARPNPSAKKSE
jgi:DNA-binding LytR/AlgR family response regulator